jgi:alpha-galactosidase
MAAAVNNNKSAEYAGNGYWNDPDMMVTGNQGLSNAEQQSHFALWCIMSSPLMLGNDPRNMDQFEKDLITNKEIIAINQDPSGQGVIIKENDDSQIWMKKLSNERVAVLLLNLNTNAKQDVSVNLKEIGYSRKSKIRDVINHKDLGTFKKSLTISLEPHNCSLLLITK